MFLPFFAELRAAGVPVSIREFLAFLEGVAAGIATYDLNGFYHLARVVMVKDEQHLDRFDRAFAASFNGLEAIPDAAVLDALPEKIAASGSAWEDLTGAVDIAFRAIPLRGDLLQNPAFLRLDFYERPGALHDFLAQRIRGNASLCYFNYRQSGERIGRALIGLDFPSPFERDALLMTIPSHGEGYRLCEPVDEATRQRLTGG